MLKEITAIQENDLIAFEVKGKLEQSDYQEILHPMIDNAAKENKKIRALIHFGQEFEGFTAAAAWEDFKLGMHHWNSFAKLALVTDIDWLKATARLFMTMMPGEVRTFSNSEINDAIDWVAKGS
jgi:hypothetical protein